MKKLLLLAMFISLTVTALAQGVILNNDGTISIQTGSTIINSNGSLSTIQGSFIVNSDGTQSIIAGSSVINPNGSTSTITSPLFTDKPDENSAVRKRDLIKGFPRATLSQSSETLQPLRHPNSTDPFHLNQDTGKPHGFK